jgi:hypothetical protein
MEMFAVCSVLFILISLTGVVSYRARRRSAGLVASMDDLHAVVVAGELWRDAVRAADAVAVDDAGTFAIRRGDKTTFYRLNDATVERRAPGGDWLPVLGNVKSSRFVRDSGKHVTAWRWEIGLRTRREDPPIQPRFTFAAVPGFQPPAKEARR